jgi:hypothetical protein
MSHPLISSTDSSLNLPFVWIAIRKMFSIFSLVFTKIKKAYQLWQAFLLSSILN